MPGPAERWNHNIQYHSVILGAVPDGCTHALDVGCGEGHLTRALHPLVPHVVGIDSDEASIDLARSQDSAGIDYVVGDVLTHPFEPASFDLVTAVASLHHMDATAGLERMASLLRPGGLLAILGLARSRHPADFALDLAAVVGSRIHRLTKAVWAQPSPTVWPPPETYRGMRALASRVLPGCRYRQHLLWRYSLVWTKAP